MFNLTYYNYRLHNNYSLHQHTNGLYKILYSINETTYGQSQRTMTLRQSHRTMASGQLQVTIIVLLLYKHCNIRCTLLYFYISSRLFQCDQQYMSTPFIPHTFMTYHWYHNGTLSNYRYILTTIPHGPRTTYDPAVVIYSLLLRYKQWSTPPTLHLI